jgi:phosphatidylglycerol---prolipoprotein diacylglyceryl transferase
MTNVTPHFVFESLAYFIAARLYWRAQPTAPQPPPRDRFLLLGCAIFGALLGSKALHILEHLPALRAQTTPGLWFAGKSVLGGFLGGTIAVEIGKRAIGWTSATGDAWVTPIVAGLIIGRIGCQLSGVWDLTYGTPTTLPWGWDYGDGVLRHPTAAYEIVGVAMIFLVIRRRWEHEQGARYAALLLSYCALRFVIEWLKPPFGPAAADSLPVALYAGLTAIQWAAVFGIVWFSMLLRIRLTHTTVRTQ